MRGRRLTYWCGIVRANLPAVRVRALLPNNPFGSYHDVVVPITPSRSWSQTPTSTTTDANAKPSLLGLSMRMCEPELALDNVWHVLDVLEGSPAESAGLVPYGDWIVGWSGGVLSAESDFYDLVEAVRKGTLAFSTCSQSFLLH